MPNRAVDDLSSAPATAAEWVVRLHSDQLVRNDRVGFERWQKEDPQNARTYQAHADLWDAIGNLAGDADARAILMRPQEKIAFLKRRTAMAVVAAGLAAASFAFVFVTPSVEEVQEFQTARGELRNEMLADGSSIVLDTDSAVRVVLDEHERRVVLERGQFFINVAKDVKRPLRVIVAGHEVRAIGTAFDVYRDDLEQKTKVTLEEGIVAIYKLSAVQVDPENTGLDAAAQPSAVLKPGEEAVLSASAPVQVRVVDQDMMRAWREGRIVFDDTPLAEAVKRANRYRDSQIVLGDERLADLRISGVFHTKSLNGFVEALVAALPLRVEREDKTSTRLVAR